MAHSQKQLGLQFIQLSVLFLNSADGEISAHRIFHLKRSLRLEQHFFSGLVHCICWWFPTLYHSEPKIDTKGKKSVEHTHCVTLNMRELWRNKETNPPGTLHKNRSKVINFFSGDNKKRVYHQVYNTKTTFITDNLAKDQAWFWVNFLASCWFIQPPFRVPEISWQVKISDHDYRDQIVVRTTTFAWSTDQKHVAA